MCCNSKHAIHIQNRKQNNSISFLSASKRKSSPWIINSQTVRKLEETVVQQNSVLEARTKEEIDWCLHSLVMTVLMTMSHGWQMLSTTDDKWTFLHRSQYHGGNTRQKAAWWNCGSFQVRPCKLLLWIGLELHFLLNFGSKSVTPLSGVFESVYPPKRAGKISDPESSFF